MTLTEQIWFVVAIGGFLVFLEAAITIFTHAVFKNRISRDMGRCIAGIVIFLIAIIELFNLPSGNTQMGSVPDSAIQLDWTLVIAGLALVLSLALGWAEWQRYHLRLQMKVRELQVQRSPEWHSFPSSNAIDFGEPCLKRSYCRLYSI